MSSGRPDPAHRRRSAWCVDARGRDDRLLSAAAQHRGVDEPRRDGVDGDAHGAEFEGQRLGESDDAGLGGHVVRSSRLAALGARRRDVDDAAPSSSIMSGTTAWQQSNVPVRLTARIWFHLSAVILRNGSNPPCPALLTRMVGRPKRSRTSSTRRRSGPDRSRRPRPVAVPPDATILAAAASAAARRGRRWPRRCVGGQPFADGQTDTGPTPGDDGHSSVGHWMTRRRAASCGACRALEPASYGQARCNTPRLSHITMSPTSQWCR